MRGKQLLQVIKSYMNRYPINPLITSTVYHILMFYGFPNTNSENFLDFLRLLTPVNTCSMGHLQFSYHGNQLMLSVFDWFLGARSSSLMLPGLSCVQRKPA